MSSCLSCDTSTPRRQRAPGLARRRGGPGTLGMQSASLFTRPIDTAARPGAIAGSRPLHSETVSLDWPRPGCAARQSVWPANRRAILIHHTPDPPFSRPRPWRWCPTVTYRAGRSGAQVQDRHGSGFTDRPQNPLTCTAIAKEAASARIRHSPCSMALRHRWVIAIRPACSTSPSVSARLAGLPIVLAAVVVSSSLGDLLKPMAGALPRSLPRLRRPQGMPGLLRRRRSGRSEQ